MQMIHPVFEFFKTSGNGFYICPRRELSLAFVLKEPIVREANESTTTLVADLAVHSVRQPQVDDLLDVRVIDTDASSHIDQTVSAVLATSENEKKRKYLEAVGLGNIKVFSHHTIFIHSDTIYCCIQKNIKIPYVNKLYNWSLKFTKARNIVTPHGNSLNLTSLTNLIAFLCEIAKVELFDFQFEPS